MATEIYELQARFDSKRSFYGKAHVLSTRRYVKLQSYDTIVAIYDRESELLSVLPNSVYAQKGKYSMTTQRHIREFARQLEFSPSAKYYVGTYDKNGEKC